ncbi:MAG: hypothetical protein PWQ83_1091 [Thermosipho sp. (in: thermotogales)]|nr:hypothetical protein [Thermosipho sp. (in: thermotogales)]
MKVSFERNGRKIKEGFINVIIETEEDMNKMANLTDIESMEYSFKVNLKNDRIDIYAIFRCDGETNISYGYAYYPVSYIEKILGIHIPERF